MRVGAACLGAGGNLRTPGAGFFHPNRAWLKMTRYGREELSGKTPRILQGKHTDSAVLKEWKAARRGA
jgi:hypothetical protein